MSPPNQYETPTALPPIGDGPPSLSTVSKSLNVKLMAADNTSTTLGEALARTERKKVLVILIQHFYCSSCQDYIRQISKSLRPEQLAQRDTSIIVIGCGAPSLIARYVKVTQCVYPIYADPKTRLYKLLGTHRTVSMGTRQPSYVQHSLLMGCVKSIVQGIKRVAAGDVRRGGSLRVNGGEFLFWRDGGARVNVGLLGQQRPPPKRLRRVVNVRVEQQKQQGENEEDGVEMARVEEDEDEEDEEYDLWGQRKRSDSGLNASQSHGYLEKKDLFSGVEGQRDEKYGDWKIWWCHRMRNRRDHTEIDEVKKTVGLSRGRGGDDEIEESHYENGTHANVLQGSRDTTGKLHASALRQSKQGWMRMLSSTSRKRKQTRVVTANGKMKHQNGQPNGLQNGVSEKRVRSGGAIGCGEDGWKEEMIPNVLIAGNKT